MVLLKQLDALCKPFLLFRWTFNALLPILETTAYSSSLYFYKPTPFSCIAHTTPSPSPHDLILRIDILARLDLHHFQ